MTDKKLCSVPLIDATASVKRSTLGRYTEVGARTSLVETMMDDYSYIVNDGNVIYTTIGKFCSIAAMVRINPGNHPMHRATQAHFTSRANFSSGVARHLSQSAMMSGLVMARSFCPAVQSATEPSSQQALLSRRM